MVGDHLSRLEYLKLDHIPMNDDFTYDKLIASVNSWTCHDNYSDKIKFNFEVVLIVTSVPW